MDVLENWGPSGPQAVSPLNFFDLRHYLIDRIEQQHQFILTADDYEWSQDGLDGDKAIVRATPKGTTPGREEITVRVPYVDMIDLINPLISDRVLDFAGEITADRIIDRINQIAGVPLLKSQYFTFSDLTEIRGTVDVTMSPNIANLLSVGVLTLKIRQVNVDIDTEFDMRTFPYTDMANVSVEMCLVGTVDPLEPSEVEGTRRYYGDGSYIDMIDDDTLEIHNGMMRNYWVFVRMSGRKTDIEIDGKTVNLMMEMSELNKGEVNLHVDSINPVIPFCSYSQIGTIVGVHFNNFIGFNFNPIGNNGSTADYTQLARIRIRLISEE